MGIGFAIPINRAKAVYEKILRVETLDAPASPTPTPPPSALSQIGIELKAGVLLEISSVTAGSPAELGGIRR
jgi:S1-C subfamily serine protease